MSYWTHINGAIRFDMLSFSDSPTITEPLHFGNTCSYDDGDDKWDACDVPCGSEGSLHYKYVPYENRHECSIVNGTLVIWGDLRDYEEGQHPKIIEWLDKCCKKYQDRGMFPRDGVVQINEHTYVYDCTEGEDEVAIGWRKANE